MEDHQKQSSAVSLLGDHAGSSSSDLIKQGQEAKQSLLGKLMSGVSKLPPAVQLPGSDTAFFFYPKAGYHLIFPENSKKQQQLGLSIDDVLNRLTKIRIRMAFVALGENKFSRANGFSGEPK